MQTLDLDNLSVVENVRFNTIAQEIRQEFNHVVESVSTPHMHNINWIVSSIASRNKYTSPLYIRLCSIAFIEAELQSRHDIGLIIVSDKPLAALLENTFKSRSRFIDVHCTERLPARLRRLSRPIRQYLIAVVIFSLRCLGRSKTALSKLPAGSSISLVDTFVLNNNAGDEGSLCDGEYKDRYYPGLLANLTEQEKGTIFFLPTIVGFKNPIEIFKRIRQAKDNFLIHDDFLKFSDYVAVLSQPFRLLNCKIPQTNFRGFDITGLLKHEHITNCSDVSSLLGILYYQFAYRLSQQKIQVRLLVDWYENQVIDRAMIVGFHRFHPETKVIGYQGYVIAKSLHLYVCPNKTEWLGKAVPDVIYVVGEALQESLLEFCKDVNVDVAPGFRFQKIWRERRHYPDKGIYTVLIGLPIDLNDSAYMLKLISSALPILKNSGIRFWIKPHPTWSPDRIKQLLPGAWPSEFDFKIGDFHDAVEGSNLLISNASSVSLEALVKGLPVIIIGAQAGITQNPIPENVLTDSWKVIYTADECIEAIQTFAQSEPRPSGSVIDNDHLKKQFFHPVTRESVLKFMDLEESAL